MFYIDPGKELKHGISHRHVLGCSETEKDQKLVIPLPDVVGKGNLLKIAVSLVNNNIVYFSQRNSIDNIR